MTKNLQGIGFWCHCFASYRAPHLGRNRLLFGVIAPGRHRLQSAQRGEPDPLPEHPGQVALNDVERLRQMDSDEERKAWLQDLPQEDWPGYLAARRYHDAVRRNRLIEQPELIPDKLERVRALVRLGYGTPHYEPEALVANGLGQ
jgi:hypothetical protein